MNSTLEPSKGLAEPWNFPGARFRNQNNHLFFVTGDRGSSPYATFVEFA